ncbi:MAG: hypothetical protein RL885_19700 [Planctomycetota bacterium]
MGKLRLGVLASAACLLGLIIAFHPMITSSFRLEHGDTDSRFLGYVLEHGYRWLNGDAFHSSFWSPPIFHPQQNVSAYGDTLLTLAPFYWVWRVFGLTPDTSFSLWLITLTTLNYLAALFLLRRGFSFSWPATIFGAALFAFASPRLQQLTHGQLIPGFWVLLAIFALQRLLTAGSKRWIALFFAAYAAQVYANIYIAWFFSLCLAAAGSVALCSARSRNRLAELLRGTWPMLLASGAAFGLVVLPLAARYLHAADNVTLKSFEEISLSLPRPHSWLHHGEAHWLYGWLTELIGYRHLPLEQEHRLGIGFLTLTLALIGLYRHRREPLVRFLVLPVLIICFIATALPGGIQLWRAVYESVPGAYAIRAVGRIVLLALIPLAVGLAYFAEDLLRRDRVRWVPALILLCLLEQGSGYETFDRHEAERRVQALVAEIPADCDAFFYAPVADPRHVRWITNHELQIDAMWASLRARTPTINGYSGCFPPDWDLYQNIAWTPRDEARIRAAYRDWIDQGGLADEAIRFLTSPSPSQYLFEPK